MQQLRGRGRGQHRTVGAVTVGLMAIALLAGCTSGGSGGSPAAGSSTGSSSSASSSASSSSVNPAVQNAVITLPSSSTRISPADPVSVSIANGKLTAVDLVNPAGKHVKGSMTDDGSTWRTTEPLGYDKTYRLTASGANGEGAKVTRKSTVTTLAPDNMTMPSITDLNGGAINHGKTYGVGMVVRVHFDEQVNRAKAQRTLSVETSPKVTGGWYWSDNQNAFWRPESYYAPGTTVQVKADAYGKKVGQGLYGQSDVDAGFTIGQKRVTIADPKTHMVRTYFDDKLVRTMPTSMGKGGYEPYNKSINYWTMHGTYTVLTHENPAIMTSGSYGVPKQSPNYYPPEKIYYATKISTDGIYLHELNTTIWAQGHQNVSHGCLNLRTSNAKWFFNHSRIGDVVQVKKGLGNPEISFNQGGQWSVSWADWQKGSALR